MFVHVWNWCFIYIIDIKLTQVYTYVSKWKTKHSIIYQTKHEFINFTIYPDLRCNKKVFLTFLVFSLLWYVIDSSQTCPLVSSQLSWSDQIGLQTILSKGLVNWYEHNILEIYISLISEEINRFWTQVTFGQEVPPGQEVPSIKEGI